MEAPYLNLPQQNMAFLQLVYLGMEPLIYSEWLGIGKTYMDEFYQRFDLELTTEVQYNFGMFHN